MRTITRVGLIVAAVGLVALYGLQIVAGLFAAPAVALIGVITGLGVAKWLERGWYGRQFSAGLRAGVIACGATGAGAMLFLLLQGPHSLDALAARSQLGPLSLSSVIAQYASLGWVGIDVGASLVSLIVGIFLTALTTQLFAWSKSRHSLRVVEQARLVAESFNRSSAWTAPPSSGRMTAGPMVGPSLNTLWPQPAPPSGSLGATPAPQLPSALGAGSAWGAVGASSRPLAQAQPQPQAPAAKKTPKAPTPQAAPQATPGANFGGGLTAMAQTTPPPLTTQAPKGAKGAQAGSAQRATLAPRPQVSRSALNQGTLNEAQRAALGEWANDPAAGTPPTQGKAAAPVNAEDAPTEQSEAVAPQSREPNPSAYLNSETAPPKRRKKQNTRDWLC